MKSMDDNLPKQSILSREIILRVHRLRSVKLTLFAKVNVVAFTVPAYWLLTTLRGFKQVAMVIAV